ncbi:hypothetical protein ENBRE01_0235 [Enteropsectra breve]|nr:hypothetical protein ENBRE01_0235 [Enteropsectra breve]
MDESRLLASVLSSYVKILEEIKELKESLLAIGRELKAKECNEKEQVAEKEQVDKTKSYAFFENIFDNSCNYSYAKHDKVRTNISNKTPVTSAKEIEYFGQQAHKSTVKPARIGEILSCPAKTKTGKLAVRNTMSQNRVKGTPGKNSSQKQRKDASHIIGNVKYVENDAKALTSSFFSNIETEIKG